MRKFKSQSEVRTCTWILPGKYKSDIFRENKREKDRKKKRRNRIRSKRKVNWYFASAVGKNTDREKKIFLPDIEKKKKLELRVEYIYLVTDSAITVDALCWLVLVGLLGFNLTAVTKEVWRGYAFRYYHVEFMYLFFLIKLEKNRNKGTFCPRKHVYVAEGCRFGDSTSVVDLVG